MQRSSGSNLHLPNLPVPETASSSPESHWKMHSPTALSCYAVFPDSVSFTHTHHLLPRASCNFMLPRAKHHKKTHYWEIQLRSLCSKPYISDNISFATPPQKQPLPQIPTVSPGHFLPQPCCVILPSLEKPGSPPVSGSWKLGSSPFSSSLQTFSAFSICTYSMNFFRFACSHDTPGKHTIHSVNTPISRTKPPEEYPRSGEPRQPARITRQHPPEARAHINSQTLLEGMPQTYMGHGPSIPLLKTVTDGSPHGNCQGLPVTTLCPTASHLLRHFLFVHTVREGAHLAHACDTDTSTDV